jgi:hypothetical protein
MQNLQQVAFSNIQQQLTTQDAKLTTQKQENITAIEAAQANIIQQTRATVDAAVRQYNFKPMDEKIEKVKKSILFEQRRKKEKPNLEKIAKKYAEIDRLQGLKEQEDQLGISSYKPPSGAEASIQAVVPTAQSMKAGGGIGVEQPSATQAQPPKTFSFQETQSSSTLLNSVDINSQVANQFVGDTKNVPKMAQGGGAADIQANIAAFQSNLEGNVSSGTGVNIIDEKEDEEEQFPALSPVVQQKKAGRPKKKK